MRDRRTEAGVLAGAGASPRKLELSSGKKRPRTFTEEEEGGVGRDGAAMREVLEKLEGGHITEKSITGHLMEAIEAQLNDEDEGGGGGPQESGSGKGRGAAGSSGGRKGGSGKKNLSEEEVSLPLYLVPVPGSLEDDGRNDLYHPLFTFRPLKPLRDWDIKVE